MSDLIALLQSNATALVFITGLLGLLIGSFLNVVIYRLPIMLRHGWKQQCDEFLGELERPDTPAPVDTQSDAQEKFNLVSPRSSCPHCGHKITALENVPIFSYLTLKGRCSKCKTRISPRYPIIELVTAILSALVAWRFGYGTVMVAALFLTWALVCLTMIDFDHKLLPDDITLPYMWAGIVLAFYGVFTDLQSSVIGALAGYLSLWSFYWIFKLLTKKEGMGYGDFKLFAALGAWLGYQMLLPIILLSSLVGAIVGISLILFLGRDRNIPIPFGPYIAAAGWIALMWGWDIIATYKNISGIS